MALVKGWLDGAYIRLQRNLKSVAGAVLTNLGVLPDGFLLEGGTYDPVTTIVTQTSSAAALSIPDLAGVAQEWVFAKKAQTLLAKTLTSPVIDGIASAALLKGVIAVPMSFETAGIGVMTVYFPFACTIGLLRSVVTKALAATDTGTLTGKNAAGTGMTGGVVTIAASEAIGGLDVSSAISGNNAIAADSFMTITSAKTTVGGEATCFIEFTRTP